MKPAAQNSEITVIADPRPPNQMALREFFTKQHLKMEKSTRRTPIRKVMPIHHP